MHVIGFALFALLAVPTAHAGSCGEGGGSWGVADPIVNAHCDPEPNCVTPEQRHQCDLSGAVICPQICSQFGDGKPPPPSNGCVSQHEHDQCNLTLAVYCPPVCAGGAQSTHGQADTHTATSAEVHHGGRQDADFAVKFSFQSYDRCVHDLSMGAAQDHAGVKLPPNVSLPEYCKRLYPTGLTGVESATLQVTFHLGDDTCVDQLTDGAKAFDGTVQFTNGGSAESFCNSLFTDGGDNEVEVDHLNENHTSRDDGAGSSERVRFDTGGANHRDSFGNGGN